MRTSGYAAVVAILTTVSTGDPRRARADDTGDRRKAVVDLLAAQARALNAHDAKAFAATFDSDGFAFLPSAADEANTADAIQAASKRWLAGLGSATFTIDQPHYGSTWYDAELVVTPGGRLRITGVVRSSHDDSLAYKVGAIHISAPAADKMVIAAAAAGKLPALPKLEGGRRDPENDVDKVAAFARRLFDDPAVAVVGSTAAEHAAGKTSVSKLLTSWRTLRLVATECKTAYDSDVLLGWEICHVEATMRTASGTVKVPYRALVILDEPPAAAADQGAKPFLIAAHFSVATR